MMIEVTAIRHGQSAANVALAAAAAAGLVDSGITGRDADVTLTNVGRRQAAHVGWWLAELPSDRRPDVAVCSPYLRARETWRVAMAAAAAIGVTLPEPALDDRLVDRLLGEWELLTIAAINQRYPEEAARRWETDEFIFRPPGGETFGDLAERVASFVADARRRYAGRRLVIVAHDAVILMLRKVLDGLSWPEIRAVNDAGSVANGSVSQWADSGSGLRLVSYNLVDHLS